MFKKLKEKLDETGLKTKLLDYAANASSGSGEASGNKPQAGSSNTGTKRESIDSASSNQTSTSDQSQDVTIEDWSIKGEPPPIGWAPSAANSPPEVSKPAVLPSDTEESEIDDVNTSLEGVTKEKLLTELTKWHARYQKAKAKYSQRTKAYQELNYEKEKIQSALAETQDRLLRRQAELREQCVLEQQAKAHLEQNLRVSIEEKDQLISVLQTKIGLLKDDKNLSEQSAVDSDKEHNENIEELQKKVKRLEELLNRCRATLNSNKEQSQKMKEQLEEKDKEVKHALEQELLLKEQLLFLEQESRKECKSCHQLRNDQHQKEQAVVGLQEHLKLLQEKLDAKEQDHLATLEEREKQEQALVGLQEQLKNTQEKLNENERHHFAALEERQKQQVLIKEQLAESENRRTDMIQHVRTELELKEQSHASVVQAFEEKCHSLELQIEDLQGRNAERDSQVEKMIADARLEKTSIEEDMQVKCQQIEGLMQELKKDSEDTVQLKVECDKLELLVKVKQEEIEKLAEKELELRENMTTWKEKCEAFENQLSELVANNQVLEASNASLEKALQEAKENVTSYMENNAVYAENEKSFEMQIQQLLHSAEERTNQDIALIASLKDKCEQMEKELSEKDTALQKTVQVVELEKDGLNTARKEYHEKEDNLKQIISSLEIKCQGMEKELSEKEKAHQETVQVLESEKEDLTTAREELHKMEDNLKRTISSLEIKCASLEENIQLNSTDLSKATEHYEKKCRDLLGCLESKERDMTQLNILLEEKIKEFDMVSREKNDSIQTCQALEVKCQNLIGQLSSIQNDSSQTIQELQTELQAMLNCNSAQSEDLKSLKEKNEQLEEHFSQVNRDHEEELQKWKDKFSVLETSLKEKEESLLISTKSFEESIQSIQGQLNLEKSRLEERVKELELECQHSESREREANSLVQNLQEKCCHMEKYLLEIENTSKQQVNELEAKYKLLQESLESKVDLENTSHTLQKSCQDLQEQLREKEERLKASMLELESRQQEVSILKEKEQEDARKIQNLDEKCSSYESRIQEADEANGILIRELEGTLLNLRKDHEEKLAEHALAKKCLEDDYNLVKVQLAEMEDKFCTTVSSLEETMLNKETDLRKENECDRQGLERRCQELEEQLKDREISFSSSIKTAEEKCQELTDSFQETIREKDSYIRQIESKSEQMEIQLRSTNESFQNMVQMWEAKYTQLESMFNQNVSELESLGLQLQDKDRSFHDTVQLWETKYLQLEDTVREKETENAGYIRMVEEKEKLLAEQTLSVKSFQEKCRLLEDAQSSNNQETFQKLEELEVRNRQVELVLEEKESALTQTRKLLDENICQTDLLKDAERRYFEKIQSLEELCQHLESQLEEREESSSTIINSLKDKCLQLEATLRENTGDNSRKTTQLQEKCQRLEIQLKDIEEDSSQTIKSLEERCETLQKALQNTELLKADNDQLIKQQCHNLGTETNLEGSEKPDSIMNSHEPLTIMNSHEPDTKFVNSNSETLELISSLRNKCEELEEKDSKSISTIDALNERVSNVEKLLTTEQSHGTQILNRLSKLQGLIKNNDDNDNALSSETKPLDWQSQAEAILNRVEVSLVHNHTQEEVAVPEFESLFEQELLSNLSQQQIKLLMQEMSKHIRTKDWEHQKELELTVEKAEAMEQRFMQEETREVQQLAEQVSELSAANEDIREHFLLQIQEKDAEIQGLQKQLQSSGMNRNSDWDNAWDMEEDEMCNNAPVQSLVKNELQAVMNENKADLDQLERFLSYPSANSTTPKLSLEPTEYEYLRNILLAYMTGREPLVMAKVITAVLRFPEKDTQEILRREAMKNSVS